MVRINVRVLKAGVSPNPEASRTPTSSQHDQFHNQHIAMADTMTNGDVSHAPIEVCFPLPRAPHTNIHVQLTDNGPNIVLFLTTATPESATSAPLGSFVYAMPNVRPLSPEA